MGDVIQFPGVNPKPVDRRIRVGMYCTLPSGLIAYLEILNQETGRAHLRLPGSGLCYSAHISELKPAPGEE